VCLDELPAKRFEPIPRAALLSAAHRRKARTSTRGEGWRAGYARARRPCLAGGTALGPCATFSGEDTWAEVPFVEGVVLIGDAAGYSNPLIGQGLSLALRDARVLSEILVSTERWSPESFLPYAEERRKRVQRVRFTAALMAELYGSFGPQRTARRRHFLRRLPEPEFRGRTLLTSGCGPRSPAWAYTEDFRKEVLK
jgi:2-polyprenyl-6-methoxyphenol hydroxylase-like FAD-dependent oxidoreductase